MWVLCRLWREWALPPCRLWREYCADCDVSTVQTVTWMSTVQTDVPQPCGCRVNDAGDTNRSYACSRTATPAWVSHRFHIAATRTGHYPTTFVSEPSPNYSCNATPLPLNYNLCEVLFGQRECRKQKVHHIARHLTAFVEQLSESSV